MKRFLLVLPLVALVGCNGLDRLMNGPPRHRDQYDTSPAPYYIEGVTSFDYDTVYNVPEHDHIEVKRPGDTSYWTINIYSYAYDRTAKQVHFGKRTGSDLHVYPDPIAPTGTLYRIAVN